VNSKDTIKLANDYRASLWQIPSPMMEGGVAFPVSHSVPSPYGVAQGVRDWYRCEVHYRAINFFEKGEVPPSGKDAGILYSRPSHPFTPQGFDCMHEVTDYVTNAKPK
jgi:hypothetical protein